MKLLKWPHISYFLMIWLIIQIRLGLRVQHRFTQYMFADYRNNPCATLFGFSHISVTNNAVNYAVLGLQRDMYANLRLLIFNHN